MGSDPAPAPPDTKPGSLIPGDKLDEVAADLVRHLLGEPVKGIGSTIADIFGGLVGDRVRQWRTRNLVTGLAATAHYLRVKGIPLDKARALPDGEMFTMFENLSKQDDPDLVALWSGLLANAVSPDSEMVLEPILIETLKQISGGEAVCLEYIWNLDQLSLELRRRASELRGTTGEKLELQEKLRVELFALFDPTLEPLHKRILEMPSKRFSNAINNLTTLRLISIPPRRLDSNDLFAPANRSGDQRLNPTAFVDAFNRLSASAILAGGNAKGVVNKAGFVSDTYDRRAPLYGLTELGVRLMSASHMA